MKICCIPSNLYLLTDLTKIPMSVNTDVCQHIKPETLKDLLAPSTVLQQAVAIVNGVFMGVCLIGNILVGFHGNLERLKIVSLILFVLSVIGMSKLYFNGWTWITEHFVI